MRLPRSDKSDLAMTEMFVFGSEFRIFISLISYAIRNTRYKIKAGGFCRVARKFCSPTRSY